MRRGYPHRPRNSRRQARLRGGDAGEPGLDLGAQILVRGGDHADVDVDGVGAPHPFELVLLKDAQDLGLGVEAHVPDLVQEHRAAVGLLENARLVRDVLNQLSIPYYVVAGNHDYRPANQKHLRKGFHYLSIEEFIQFFKGHGYIDMQRYYARSLAPGLRLIGLDACLPGIDKWGGILPEEQLHWLDRELTDHAEALHLIFMHHNVVRWSEEETVGGPKEFFCIDNDIAVRKLLAKHARTAPVVISGHRHAGLRHKEIAGVNYFLVPSINSHPMRYAVFTLTPQSIAWKTPMASVAEPVHLEARENLLDDTWWREKGLK